MDKETVIIILATLILIISIIMISVVDDNNDEVYAADEYASPFTVELPELNFGYGASNRAYHPELEINYIPAEPIEEGDWIMPEDVVNLDEFNQTAAMLAQLVFGEANGLTKYEKSLVIWTVFNRYDMGTYGDTLYSVLTSPNQFYYKPSFPVTEENFQLAVDCLLRWQSEKYSTGSVGRTLPSRYTSFYGDGKHNYFRTDDKSDVFDFSGFDPYGDKPFAF